MGEIGLLHARNALAAAGAELVAVASGDGANAEAAARSLGRDVRGLTHDELVSAGDVDAVVLATRSIDHARRAVPLIASGKHLLLEKPGATDLAGHAELREAAGARPGVVVQVAYNRRFDSDYREARRLVREGAVGRPLLVLMTSRDMEWPAGEDPRQTGGFLLDMAAHDHDAACWLLGQEPVDVFAARQALVHPELGELGDLDNGVVTVRFDGGGIATTHVSRTCRFGHDVRFEVVGEEGSIVAGGGIGGSGVAVLNAGERERFPAGYAERFRDGYRVELDAFIAACRGVDTGDAEPAGLEDDRRVVEIGVAARASAVAGRPLETGVDWPWPAVVA
jgi:myo-inositol 2-dehydrogenase/D-chiro-inositol 1-dehydrogenase